MPAATGQTPQSRSDIIAPCRNLFEQIFPARPKELFTLITCVAWFGLMFPALFALWYTDYVK